MSEPKFTPGPWYVENGVPGKPRIFSSADSLLKSIVCECIGAGSRRKHDATLIATAPEMYKQLDRALGLICKIVAECDLSGIDEDWIESVQVNGEQVLKKARGE